MKNSYRLLMIFVATLAVQLVLAADERDLLELADNAEVTTAAIAFIAAYDYLGSISSNEKSIVANYYYNDFSTIYSEANDNVDPHVSDVIANLDDKGYYLQYYYLAANPEGLGAKEALDQAQDGSDWSAVHAVWHPLFAKEVDERDLYDFFIINNNGDIVYTVYKETDIGTNLESGSFASTGLGEAYSKVKDTGSLAISDVEPYWPSYDIRSQFVCTTTGEVAIICLQIAPDQLAETGDIRNEE